MWHIIVFVFVFSCYGWALWLWLNSARIVLSAVFSFIDIVRGVFVGRRSTIVLRLGMGYGESRGWSTVWVDDIYKHSFAGSKEIKLSSACSCDLGQLRISPDKPIGVPRLILQLFAWSFYKSFGLLCRRRFKGGPDYIEFFASCVYFFKEIIGYIFGL